MEKRRCTAIVLAAGAGRRMQSKVAKQYLLLNKKPILWYALQAFEQSPIIDEVILVVGQGEVPYCQAEIIEKYELQKVSAVIEGGAERYLSVWQALKLLAERRDGEWGYVFIHDGARPFVKEQVIRDTYEAAVKYGGCVAAMPVKDTIKIADEQEFAAQTPERKTVWAVQTPQVFEAELIQRAYKKLMETLLEPTGWDIQITDDAMVVETMLEQPVKLVRGSYENIKITTPEDMMIAESLLKYMG